MKQTKLLLSAVFLFISASVFSQLTTISGHITDAYSKEALEEVEIAFINGNSQSVFVEPSNLSGDFEFKTNLKPGDKIQLHISKQGYRRGFIERVIETNGLNLTITLEPKSPGEVDGDIRIIGHVTDFKGKTKAIAGAQVWFINEYNRKIPVRASDQTGYFEINTNLEPGEEVAIFVENAPTHKTTKANFSIKKETANNRLEVYLRPKNYLPKSTYLMASGGLLLSTGLITRLSSNSAYDKHKNFQNTNRLADYDKANNLNKVSILTTTPGLILAGIGIYYSLTGNKKLYEIAANSKVQPTLRYSRIGLTEERLSTGLTIKF